MISTSLMKEQKEVKFVYLLIFLEKTLHCIILIIALNHIILKDMLPAGVKMK